MNVYFEDGYWGNKRGRRPCRALPVRQAFTWNGFEWLISGAYVCASGLVLDLCKKVPAGILKEFLQKWEPVAETDELTYAQESMLEFENPLEGSMQMTAFINSKEIKTTRSCSTSYNPFQNGTEAHLAGNPEDELIEFYKLDKSCGWFFTRISFRWDYKKIPAKILMKLKLKPNKYNIACEACADTVMGDKLPVTEFFHPFTGSRHLLYIDKLWQETLEESQAQFGTEAAYVFPRHFQGVEYHFDENTDACEYMLKDSEQGDAPLRKQKDGQTGNGGSGCCSIGIIGGSSGAADLELEDGNRASDENGLRKRNGFSRLKFEPVESTRWQIDAVVSPGEEAELEIRFL